MSSQIREHMEVVGSDGIHVGTVDRMERGSIRIAKGDAVGGRHRIVPGEWIERIDDKVRLNRPSAAALRDIDRRVIDAAGQDPVDTDAVVGAAGAVVFHDEPPHDDEDRDDRR